MNSSKHHQRHTIQANNKGQGKEVACGGTLSPPRDRPSGGARGGAGRCARVRKNKGFSVHKKKKCKGFPHTHEKYLKSSHCTPVVRSLEPPERGKSAHRSPMVVSDF